MFHHKKGSPYCLVLSGGGAKGVYHIGAWKALRELDIPVNAFIGNSIGAIMAGFLAQGKGGKLEEIGNGIGIDFIMKIPKELVKNGELNIGKSQLPSFRSFYQEIIQKGGIDISPLRALVYDNLSEDEIRRSGNDLGVVTFNISDIKPVKTYLDEMEEGAVLDYLLASAAFPGLEQTVIKGKKFIDGGVYDNLPYDMAKARGYKNIIIIDISGMGVNRRPEIQGTNTIYIKNSINMGGLFDFNREFLDQFQKLGYLDTMKTFDVFKGYRYFFEQNPKMEKALLRQLENEDTLTYLEGFLPPSKEGEPMGNRQLIRQILPDSMQKNKDLLYSLADCTASAFSLDRIRKYTMEDLLRMAKERQGQINAKIEEMRSSVTKDEKIQLTKMLTLLLKEAGNPEEELESPYYYYCLLQGVLEQNDTSILMKALFAYYPELLGGMLFLNIMTSPGIPGQKRG
jgi:NTE family protein